MDVRSSLQLCVFVASFIALAQAFGAGASPWRSGSTSGPAKRVTIFDRMGRYYGKRSSPEIVDRLNSKPRPLFTVADLQDRISSSPKLMAAVISAFVDENGDDLIDENELKSLVRIPLK